MDRKDKIVSVAAITLVAVIGGFAILAEDFGRTGAYYYFSRAPDPDNNDLTVGFENKLPRDGPGYRQRADCNEAARLARRCSNTLR